MSLNIAVQMDSLEKLNLTSDTTIALIETAQKRGHRVFIYHPERLQLNHNIVSTFGHYIHIHEIIQTHTHTHTHTHTQASPPPYSLSDEEHITLSNMDVILIRQEPPYDMTYLTSTYLLEKLLPDTLCVNDPIGIRNSPEKLLITQFSDFMPPTLISRNKEEISHFINTYNDIVVKPLYGYAGQEVFRLKKDDENRNALIDMFYHKYREPMIVQKFLPQVYEGDKRVFILNGEYIGGINRLPDHGQFRSNFATGGHGDVIKDHDYAFAKKAASYMGETFRKHGLYFVGIDIIGEYVTEINVTCPTGIRTYQQLHATNLADNYWQGIEDNIIQR